MKNKATHGTIHFLFIGKRYLSKNAASSKKDQEMRKKNVKMRLQFILTIAGVSEETGSR